MIDDSVCLIHEVCVCIFLVLNLLSSQKRQLAAQSGAFNLNNKIFCELFSEVAEVCALLGFKIFTSPFGCAWVPYSGEGASALLQHCPDLQQLSHC